MAGKAHRGLNVGARVGQARVVAPPKGVKVERLQVDGPLCWRLRSSVRGSLNNSRRTSLELRRRPRRDNTSDLTPRWLTADGRPEVLRKGFAHVFPELTSTVLGGLATDTIRSRQQLLVENTFLCQQLIVANRSVKRPSLRRHERGLLALLAGKIPRWSHALPIVKPTTLVRWHQQGFRLF